jgi:ribosomal protein S18 acetylase RimI-like enzyme
MERNNIESIVKNSSPSVNEVEEFFKINKSLNFRYFDKRNYDSINNHKYTCLYIVDDVYVGYGHIDTEEDKNWLGIFVSERYRGRGLGKLIMDDLLSIENDIYLTVDVDNIGAINLYKKKGFEECGNNGIYFSMKRIKK